MKAYLERFLNEGVDEMDNPQEKEEKCIPGGCRRKMCLNGTFTIIYLLFMLSIMVKYTYDPNSFVYLAKTTDVNKVSSIKASVVYNGLLFQKETGGVEITSHKGCLEKLECDSNYDSNSNRNFDTNNDVLCDNFKGSCTDDSKRYFFL